MKEVFALEEGIHQRQVIFHFYEDKGKAHPLQAMQAERGLG
jgi:hypothetical protein